MLQIKPERGREVEIETRQDEKISKQDCDIPDPNEVVYSNIPKETHMLKSLENCRYYNEKKSNMVRTTKVRSD